MSTARRWTSRLLWAVCVLAVAGPVTPDSADATTAPHTPLMTAEGTTLRYPTIRLRKLHLVRPDLIPYPLSYEIVC